MPYVDETLDGLCAAHPEFYRRIGATGRAIARAAGTRAGKVGIASGGGSGHLPVFTGYVGRGLLDSCAIGDVFSSPGADQMVEAIRAANAGAGVLLLFGNYGGDSMNFEMAAEIVDLDSIRTTTVKGADDVASAGPDEREKRRGVAGLIYAYKLAGAKAEMMASLDEVTAVARKAGGFHPLDRRRPHPVHRPGRRQAQLPVGRHRDGVRHGHSRRAGRVSQFAQEGRRHRG